MGCVKAVIHAGGEAQRHESAVEIVTHQLLIAQKIHECVGEALGLEDGSLAHGPHFPHDAVARTYDDARILIDPACPLPQLSGKELLKAAEARFPGITQIELREESPDRNTDT